MFGSNEESFNDLEKLEILLETIPHLVFSAVKIYFLLKEIANKDKVVITSYSELARYMCLERHAVAQAIEDLKEKNLISVDHTRDEKTNALIIFLRPITEGWNKINLKWRAGLISCEENVQTEKDVMLKDPVLKLYYELNGVERPSTFDVKRNYTILQQIRAQDKYDNDELMYSMRKCFLNASDNGKPVNSMMYVAGFIGKSVKEKKDDEVKKKKVMVNELVCKAKEVKEDTLHAELEHAANKAGLTYELNMHKNKLSAEEVSVYMDKVSEATLGSSTFVEKIRNDVKNRWVYKLETAIVG